MTTAGGRTVALPPELNLEIVAGLDEDGRIVVDNLDALKGNGPFLFGLTLCCNAFDKGVEDGIVCRACYDDADVGNYLYPVVVDGQRTFPTLDPVKEIR